MKIQQPLFWHQGLFLQPQHLQLQDLTAHSRLLPLFRFQSPHLWGVVNLEIDEEAIGTGTFSLHSGEFIFQDGTHVDYPGNALLAGRRFQPSLVEGRGLQMYLGIRKWDDAGGNVTEIDGMDNLHSASTRYLALREPEEVRDLHGKGPQGEVRRLHHLLKLFWEGELEGLGDYLLIPLARLEDAGGCRLSRTFVPPSVTVAASKPLGKLVREIRDQLAARAHQLGEHKGQRGLQTAELGPREIEYLLALRTLNRHLPQLIHLGEAPAVHPWAVYGTLRQLIGELSTFSPRVNFQGEDPEGGSALPGYAHERLWDCFFAARELLTELLDELTAGPDYTVSLLYDGSCFTAELKPRLLEGMNRYFLAVKSEEEPEPVRKSVESAAKLSAREHLPLLASHALPGIPLEYLPLPPPELPRRAHTLYFAVDHLHPQWQLVARERNIALDWGNAPADLAVELLVLERTRHSR